MKYLGAGLHESYHPFFHDAITVLIPEPTKRYCFKRRENNCSVDRIITEESKMRKSVPK